MVTCDECGVKVDSTGYLGGGIVCTDCAEAAREQLRCEEIAEELRTMARALESEDGELVDVEERPKLNIGEQRVALTMEFLR